MEQSRNTPAARARDVTRVLQSADGAAAELILPLVYEELLVIARQRLRDERANHTLGATALVHEAWLRLGGDDRTAWQNRAHFFGAAARAMRQVLIDYARRRGRDKRVGERRQLPLSVVDLAVEAPLEDVLAVDRAVDKLAQQDPHLAQVVQLRFYAGLSVEETALALGVSERSVRREWSLARAWLSRELER